MPMADFFRNLLSTDGFAPLRQGDGWSGGHFWLHTLSDLLIWLACFAIPLVLAIVLRRRATLPFRGLIVLLAAFALCCGTIHLLDALLFDWPAYRLSGLVKGVTAAVAWLTLAALVSAVPRLLRFHDATVPDAPTPASADPVPPQRYIVAAGLAGLALLVRFGLDPLLSESRGFVLPLLAVMASAWYGGFWPGLLALALGGGGFALLFISYNEGLAESAGLATQADLALYVFCGLAAATLGQAQRSARRAAEVATVDLHESNRQLARSQWATAEALTQLDAFLTHAPVGLAFYDRDLRYLRINNYLAEANKRSPADHLGKSIAEVLPDLPPAVTASFRTALDTGTPVRELVVRDTTGPDSVWHVSAFPAHDPYGVAVGLAVVAQDVTEAARQQAALQASEERFRTLWEAAPVGISLSRAGTHLFTNRAFVALHGLPPGTDLAGRSILDQVAPADRDLVAERVRRRAAGEDVPDGYEVHERRADGTEFLAELRIARLTLADGPASVCFMTDVTDRRRVQEELERRVADRTAELRRETAFLGAVLESVEDAIVACDADGHLTLFNRATKQLHGLPAEPVPPERWADHYSLYAADGRTPLGRDEVPLFRALAGEDVRDAEMVVAATGAEPRTLLASGRGLFDEDGRRLGAVVSMHDITDRRAAEAARGELVREQTLRQEQERFRLLADAMPQIVSVSRPDGAADYLNRGWFEYTGQPADAPDTVAAIHPDDRERVAGGFATARDAGTRYAGEVRLRRHDGEYRWFLTRSEPIRDAAGAVAHWYGTSTDIDDQKRTEERLAASAADLRDAQRVAQVGNWRWDVAADTVTGSEELYRIYGLDPAAGIPPVAEHDGTLYTHDNWRRVVAAVRHTADTGEPVELDVPALRGGAEPIWVSIRTEAERDAAGLVATLRGTVQDITARKAAEERFAFVRRAGGVGFWYCDLPLDVLEWDERVKAHFHLPADARVTIDTFYARLHPDDREPTRRAIDRSIADRTPYDTTYRTVHPDTGAVAWVRAVGRTGYGPDGAPARFDGVTTDVTAAKLAEAAVRESEALLAAVLDSLPVALAIADPAGRLVRTNRAFPAVWGEAAPLSAAVAEYRAYVGYDPGTGRRLEPHEWPLARAVLGGETVPAARVDIDRHGDGKRRHLELTAAPVVGPDGRRLGGVIAAQDVTERVRAEAALAASEAFARSVVESSPDCVKILDLDGRVQWMNDNGQRLMEVCDFRTMQGCAWATFWEAGGVQVDAEAALAAARSGRVGRFEGMCPTQAGNPRFWDVAVTAIPGADGRPAQLLSVSRDVTQVRAGQQALAASEARFRGLTDTAPQIVWEADPAGRTTFVSRYREEYTGRPVADGLGDGWQAIVRPDHVPRVAANWTDAVAGNAPYHDLYPVRRADGVYRWFQSRGRLVRHPDGTPDRWVGISTDVHDRVAAEEALAATQRTLTLALATANAGVFTWDVAADKFALRLADPANPGTLAVSRPQTYAQTMATIHPDDRDRVRAAVDACRADRSPFAETYRVGSPDAGWRWLEGRGQFEYAPGGQPLRMVGVRMDVHDRKAAEEAARRADREFRAMADSIPQLAWMTRPDGFIDWYNSRWYEYTGTTYVDMQGWGWERVHDPAELRRMLPGWKAALATGTSYEDTFPLKGADGVFRWFLTRARPIHDDAGRVVRWFGTNTDVTAQRQLEADLRAVGGRFRFLDELGQATRDADARTTLATTCRLLGEHLQASRVAYADVHPDGDRFTVPHDWTDGVASIVGEATVSLYGRQSVLDINAGRPLVVRDVDAELGPADGGVMFAATQVQAVVCCPLVRNGRLTALMAVQQTRPRDWTPAEVILIGEVVERSWAHVERARAEDAARQAAERVRTLAESVPALVWSGPANGAADYHSSRWAEFTGRPAEELMAGGWLASVHPDDRAAAVAAWDRSGPAGRPFAVEYRLRRADGAYRWQLAQALPVLDTGGAVVRWYGTVTDIDDQKRLEGELRGVSERFRTLTEAIPQMVWNADADGRVSYVNSRWRAYTGLTQEESGLGWWRKLGHPADVPAADAAWASAANTEAAPIRQELRLRRAADGTYRWFSMAVVPLRRPDGSLDQWIGSLSDIHDLKTADETIRASEAKFRQLVEAVPNLVWVTDADGRVVQLNRQWATVTGRPMDSLLGDGWASLLHPDDSPGVLAGWQAAVRHRASYAGEFRFRTADGSYRWQLARGLPVAGADGRLSQWFGTTTDIDNQKRAAELLEGQVKERTAELARSNGELEKFAYVASHDLQEPLRKMQAFGDRLASKFAAGLGPDGKDYIERMQSSAARMQTLIQDLLAYSRVAAKPRAFGPVPLGPLVAGVLSDLEALTSRTRAVVRVGDLPTVLGDLGQLRQLFQNLIANACKFHQPDRPPTVAVTAERLEALPAGVDPPPGLSAGWRLVVSDDGIGFEQQYADRIFEVFQRLHGRGTYEGTGIGLAICRKVIERHGGTITARGRPGEGAVFAVDLPDPPVDMPQ